MPIGAFCAFLGSVRLVRYFTDFLGHADKKAQILRFHSGTELGIDGSYLYGVLNGRRVNTVKFSRKFQEKLERLRRSGYVPYAADTRFVVAWKNQEMDEETAVLLPNLRLRKQTPPCVPKPNAL